MNREQIKLLADFLEALDEWGCDDNLMRASQIADFIAGGFDLTAYEEERPLWATQEGHA